MVGFAHNTAAGAGLGACGIVPQRSIAIDMKGTLMENKNEV